MKNEKKKLGILLFNGPDSLDVKTAEGLASAALGKGIEVEVFMMHKAVLNSEFKPLEKLCDQGAKITVCTHNADQFKAKRHSKFTYGSQFEHSYIIGDSDRYLAFI